jgi:hypothetical protein
MFDGLVQHSSYAILCVDSASYLLLSYLVTDMTATHGRHKTDKLIDIIPFGM